MHAPAWILKELERIHPQLRLGWVGYDRESPDDELNKGKFALIQLYRACDANKTYYSLYRDADNRGPVQGKRYDPLVREPIYLADIEPADVFSGKILPLVRRWMTPIKDRYLASAKAKGQAYEAVQQDMAEGAADLMLYNAKKSDMSDRTITNSDITEHDKSVLRGETKKDLTEAFTKVPDGAQPLV